MAFLELHEIKKSYYLGKTAFPVLRGLIYPLKKVNLFRFLVNLVVENQL